VPQVQVGRYRRRRMTRRWAWTLTSSSVVGSGSLPARANGKPQVVQAHCSGGNSAVSCWAGDDRSSGGHGRGDRVAGPAAAVPVAAAGPWQPRRWDRRSRRWRPRPRSRYWGGDGPRNGGRRAVVSAGGSRRAGRGVLLVFGVALAEPGGESACCWASCCFSLACALDGALMLGLIKACFPARLTTGGWSQRAVAGGGELFPHHPLCHSSWPQGRLVVKKKSTEPPLLGPPSQSCRYRRMFTCHVPRHFSIWHGGTDQKAGCTRSLTRLGSPETVI